MGVIYSVFPLDDKFRAALSEYDQQDEGWPDGRNPSIAEVRHALDGLIGFKADFEPTPVSGGAWGATIEDATHPEEGPWTTLRTLNYIDEAVPTEIYFEKGWPDLIVSTVARLAKTCGTLCLVPDTGEAPLVVHSGADPIHLLNAWEHTRPMPASPEEDDGV